MVLHFGEMVLTYLEVVPYFVRTDMLVRSCSLAHWSYFALLIIMLVLKYFTRILCHKGKFARTC